MQTGDPVLLSVCVCTFRRPEGLRRLLHSLAAQVGALPWEVVVVDNDVGRSAAEVAGAFASTLPLAYAMEPARGLSTARNHGVRAARGEFLAFIDDDETAAPTWLQTLHRILAETGAAAAFGPVDVEFGPGVSAAIRQCRLLAYPAFAEGDRIPWYYTRTSNVLVRRSALPDANQPFDPAFNQTGGEDIDLFQRMEAAGHFFVAVGPGAQVREYREAARANFRWALLRSIRNGGNLAALTEERRPVEQRVLCTLSALARALVFGLLAPLVWLLSPLRGLEACIEAAEHFGRFLHTFGYQHPEYGSRA